MNDIIKFLLKDNEKLDLKNKLAGGVVSEVYSCNFTDQNNIDYNAVIKHTKKDITIGNNFCSLEYKDFLPNAAISHNLDIEIQKHLIVNRPVVIKHYPDYFTTIMKNFESEGYELMQTSIIKNRLSLNSAENTGKALAEVRHQMENLNDSLFQVENSTEQFYQRFYETISLLYNNRMYFIHELENSFLNPKIKTLTWTDGHPKNIAVNEKGEVLFFDFGRSIKCDQEYILPNFIGQITLFIISQTMELSFGLSFIKNCVNAFINTYNKYDNSYQLDEKLFVRYATSELLHRGIALRWIDPAIANNCSEEEIKAAVYHFGDTVFSKEKPIVNLNVFYNLIIQITNCNQNGLYKRPLLNL